MTADSTVATWSSMHGAQLAELVAHTQPAEVWERALAFVERTGIPLVPCPSEDAELTVQAEGAGYFFAIPVLDALTKEFIEAQLTTALKLRVLAEERSRLKERVSLLSTSSFEGILVHEDGIVIEVNEQLSQLVGYSPPELLGPSTMRRCLTPRDLPMVIEKMRSGYEGTYMATAIRKDGTQFRAEFQSKQGNIGQRPVRVVAIRDVTERERMTNLLKESEQRLEHLANGIFDLTVMSRDAVVVEARGPLLKELGYERSELLGRNILDFVAAAAQPITVEVLAEGRSGAYESLLKTRDGRHIPVEIVGVLSRLEGKPTRIAGIRDLRRIRDLEEQRSALQSRVERLQRLDSLGVLLGGIAHDFNNLLMSILGNLELLELDTDVEERDASLQAARLAATQASELTRSMLSYAGRGDMDSTVPIEASELLGQVASILPLDADPSPHLTLDLTPGCLIRGDRATLGQVFMNLIKNAVDALKDSGASQPQIRLSSSILERPDDHWDGALGAHVGPGRWVRIEIEDNGPGMDQVTKDRIFEPFFTTKKRGHGLGLAACLGIVERHGGAILVETSVSVGTRFSVLLPLAERNGSEAPPKPVISVLVVGGERMVRKQMLRSLRLRGFVVSESPDGKGCIASVEKRTVDVILLDINMPDMSGSEVLRQLRDIEPNVPVVLTASKLDSVVEQELAPSSFQAFLRKPYGVVEVVETIERVRNKRSDRPSKRET